MALNIYNIPLYYISFNKQPRLENHFNLHGFTNINHFQAINGKNLSPKDLLANNLIVEIFFFT